MERKLRQCPACGEWFNTTLAVMIEHYKAKHEFHINKAFALAELITKRAWHDAKSHVTPFPESMQHCVLARMIENRISMVISATPPDGRDKFIVGAMTAAFGNGLRVSGFSAAPDGFIFRKEIDMSEESIKQAWLAEFGDDSHISLHCYTLAYKAGARDAAIECIKVAAPAGSQFCIYCGEMLAAIKDRFGLEI